MGIIQKNLYKKIYIILIKQKQNLNKMLEIGQFVFKWKQILYKFIIYLFTFDAFTVLLMLCLNEAYLAVLFHEELSKQLLLGRPCRLAMWQLKELLLKMQISFFLAFGSR